MTSEKKGPTPDENSGPLTNQSERYQSSLPRAIHLPRFSKSVRNKWVVKRDANGDQFIRLNGPKALLGGGFDHIYLISSDTVGVWLTSRQINSQVRRLKKMVPDIQIEQAGDGEAVLSCGIQHLDEICKVMGARQRRTVSDEIRERLRRISPFLTSEPLTKTASQGPNRPENDGGGQ